jgi:hypothetical protein
MVYNQLVSVKIAENRNLVISKNDKDSYTLAQQISVTEKGSKAPTNIFLRNAIHLDTIGGLEEIRDAINLVLSKKIKNN